MVVHYTHDNHHHAKKNVSVYDDKNIWLYCIVETNNNYLSSINVSEKGTKFHSFNVCFYKSWNTCWILIFPSKAFLLFLYVLSWNEDDDEKKIFNCFHFIL